MAGLYTLFFGMRQVNVIFTVDTGLTKARERKWAGTKKVSKADSISVSFTRWFDSLEALVKTFPEYESAKVNELGNLHF
jgi:hypothetical protein